MSSRTFSALLLLAGLCVSAVQAEIGIVVNRDLYPDVSAKVQQYIADLALVEGESVWLNSSSFDELSPAAALRDSIRSHAQSDAVTARGLTPLETAPGADPQPPESWTDMNPAAETCDRPTTLRL